MKLNNKANILIIGGALSHNHGQEAMTLSTIKLIKENIKNNHIYISTIHEDDRESKMIKKNNNIHFLHDDSDNLKTIIVRLIKLAIYKLFKFQLYDRFLSVIKKSDIIIEVSGDTISDIYSYSLIMVLWRYIASYTYKVPLIIFPQTIGPFNLIWTRLVGRYILENASLIFLREILSYNYLKSFLKNQNLVYSIDSAFYLNKSNSLKLENIISFDSEIIVGISLSQKAIDLSLKIETKGKSGFYDNYLLIMKKFIEFIISEYNAGVLLIPHVIDPKYNNDDRVVQKRIFNKLNTKSKRKCLNITKNYNAKELKALISGCDLFIGFRMHSNIAALSSNIPTIAISYSHKYKGIMKIYGLNDFVIDINRLELNLLKNKFSKLYANKRSIQKDIEKINSKLIENNKKILIQNLKEQLNRK